MSEIVLRDYQNEAIGKVETAFSGGTNRVLGVAATGTGKTILFSALAQRMIEANIVDRVLILAHRDELISQAVEKIRHVWPSVDVGVVKAERNEWEHQVVVGSVQSLNSRRLSKVPLDHFGLIITDECHHSRSVSYKSIYAHFQVAAGSGPFHLGVTATPDRGDGKGLDEIYDEVVFNYDLLWGIRAGFLSDMRGKRVFIDGFDTKGIKSSKGDFEVGSAGRALMDAQAPSQIAEAWVKYGEDRKTIVFTPTVETAGAVASELLRRGVSAAMVHGGTPLEERRDLLRRFKSGDVKVLCNCGVLTEGFDEPSVSCIFMARITKSRALYSQCVGRGTRRHPGKEDCLVLDAMGVTEHSLITAPSLFGLDDPDALEGGATVARAVMDQEEAQIAQGKLDAANIDLFKKVLSSPIAWVSFTGKLGTPMYSCGMGKGNPTVIIEQDADETWQTYLRWPAGSPPYGQRDLRQFANEEWYSVLAEDTDLEFIQGTAEDYIRQNSFSALVGKDAKWRQGAPTEKQLETARRMGIRNASGMTKGELSEQISKKIEARKAKTRDNRQPEWLKNKIKNERERQI